MKRQIILAAAILGIVILSACGKKDVSSDTKQEVIVQNEESTEKDAAVEETKKYKLEKHEEDWQSLSKIGEVDWNANMPRVGKFGFTNNIYVPTVLDGKKLEGDEKPYFFMRYDLIGRDSEDALETKRVENLEEVPEMMMGINQLWVWASSSISTMQRDTDEGINPVIETKEKVVIDGYEFMRVTGKFEIFNKESKEIVKERKYIAYFYNAIDPSLELDKRLNVDTFTNYMYYWCEGYAKDTEGKDFDLVIETADKIMSTFKLRDEQREYLKSLK